MGKLQRWLKTLMKRTVPDSLTALGLEVDDTPNFDAIHPEESMFPHFFSGYERRVYAPNEEKWKTFAVGLSRPGSRWSMKKIRNRIGTTRDFDMALHGMGRDCIDFKTPYGFILTLNELVACHFSEYAAGNQGWTAKVARVPYTNTGPDKLTPELAVLALCMLGAAELAKDASRISEMMCLKPSEP